MNFVSRDRIEFRFLFKSIENEGDIKIIFVIRNNLHRLFRKQSQFVTFTALAFASPFSTLVRPHSSAPSEHLVTYIIPYIITILRFKIYFSYFFRRRNSNSSIFGQKLAGVSRITSRLQTRPIGNRIQARRLGRDTNFDRRTRRFSRRFRSRRIARRIRRI